MRSQDALYRGSGAVSRTQQGIPSWAEAPQVLMFGHNASPNYASQRAIDLANQIQISWRSGKFPVKWDFEIGRASCRERVYDDV